MIKISYKTSSTATIENKTFDSLAQAFRWTTQNRVTLTEMYDGRHMVYNLKLANLVRNFGIKPDDKFGFMLSVEDYVRHGS